MKTVKIVDTPFTKKDNQINSGKSDKIKIKDYLKNENNVLGEELSFEIKYLLLKKNMTFYLKKLKLQRN